MQPRGFFEALGLQLATLGPLGRIPFAPGTWGSLASVGVLAWGFTPLPPLGKLLAVAGLFVLGGFAAGRAEALLGAKDPQCVVIDETAGQLLALLPLSRMAPLELLLGFVLFRLFDILKPWPVAASETWLPGGFGIMIDDILAGCYAALVLALLLRFL